MTLYRRIGQFKLSDDACLEKFHNKVRGIEISTVHHTGPKEQRGNNGALDF